MNKTEFESGATKELKGKLRTDLIPPEVLEGYAQVMTFGADKYADRDWEKGIPYMMLYGASLRHLIKWAKGMDLDEESGLSHLKHAMWNIAAIITYIERGKEELDDRPN